MALSCHDTGYGGRHRFSCALLRRGRAGVRDGQQSVPDSGKSENQFGSAAALRNLLVAAIVSAGWVTVEWLRGKLLFGGFPWNFIGVTQWQAGPLIQFASVTGIYGVSALVCFVNVALYFTIRRFILQVRSREKRWRLSWEFYVAMGLISVAFWHGMPQVFQLTDVSARTVRLALIQGDIPQTLKFEPEQKPMILERYRTLTESVMAARPNMIIWPETATPDALRYDRESFELATNLAVKSGAYLFTGTIDITAYSSPVEAFNGAILVHPGWISGRDLPQDSPRAVRRIRAAPQNFPVHEVAHAHWGQFCARQGFHDISRGRSAFWRGDLFRGHRPGFISPFRTTRCRLHGGCHERRLV